MHVLLAAGDSYCKSPPCSTDCDAVAGRQDVKATLTAWARGRNTAR